MEDNFRAISTLQDLLNYEASKFTAAEIRLKQDLEKMD